MPMAPPTSSNYPTPTEPCDSSFSCRAILVVCLCGIARPSGIPEPDAQQPYRATKSAPVKYDIDFRVIVTPPAGTKTLKVWVPDCPER